MKWHSFSTQRRLCKKTLRYGLYLHANIAHTKFERVLNDTDRVLLRNVSLAIWPASCSSQLIKVGVVKQLTTNNLTRERTVAPGSETLRIKCDTKRLNLWITM